MAKKVHKDGERKEEKKAVFEPPEFDEREYLTEQLSSIRMNLAFTLLGIPMGMTWSYVAIITGSAILGLFTCIAVYAALVYLLQMGLGLEILTGPKRVIATTFLLFIFTSLTFSVLFSNPPVNDATPPTISDVMVAFQPNGTEEWTVLMRHRDTLPLSVRNLERVKDNPDQRLFLLNESVTASAGDRVKVLVRAADASGLRGAWLEYGYDSIDSVPKAMERITEARWRELEPKKDWRFVGEHYYEVEITDVHAGNLYFRITVEDNAGLVTYFETKDAQESIHIGQ